MVLLALFAFTGTAASTQQTGTTAPSASTRMVFAHYMLCCPGITSTANGIEGTTVDTFKEEIRTAQAAGIDGFALNTGSWSNPDERHFKNRTAKMYQAAEELGTNFKLFFSADMCCNLTTPWSGAPYDDQGARDIIDMVTTYYDHPNQYKYQGKAFLSTFGGEETAFGYASAAEGWQRAILQPLADAGKPVYFVPHFYDKVSNEALESWLRSHFSSSFWSSKARATPDFGHSWAGQQQSSDTASYFLTGSPDPGLKTDNEHPGPNAIEELYEEFPFVDGLYYFSAIAQPTYGVTGAVNTNRWYAERSRARGKAWMAGVSPNFAAYLPGNHYRVAGNYAGGEGIQQLWRGILADQPPYVEIMTWNDFGEQTYVGPAKSKFASPPGATRDARLFPHGAYLELSKHYVDWYKTGREPAISNDKLFYFYRTHGEGARTCITEADCPPPDNWDSVEDKIYVTAMLEEPATVRITSGGITKDFPLQEGIQNVSMDFAQGTQKVELIRNGATVLQDTGERQISDKITEYNFNYYSNYVPRP